MTTVPPKLSHQDLQAIFPPEIEALRRVNKLIRDALRILQMLGIGDGELMKQFAQKQDRLV